MSTFTSYRDKAEAFFAKMFHIAEPVLEQAATAAGTAIAQAALNGTAHGSDEMFDVAVKAVKAAAPDLRVTLQASIAAHEVDHADPAAPAAKQPDV